MIPDGHVWLFQHQKILDRAAACRIFSQLQPPVVRTNFKAVDHPLVRQPGLRLDILTIYLCLQKETSRRLKIIGMSLQSSILPRPYCFRLTQMSPFVWVLSPSPMTATGLPEELSASIS